MTIYGVDVASYQGQPDWPKVAASGARFGFSKVTEGTSYLNPTWSHNRAGMLAQGDGFLAGAYHFLHGGNGAGQARYFLDHAGDVSDLAVALDVEAAGADAATARDFVAEFKRLTNNHPVIGYWPKWYWQAHGKPALGFFDGLWQSAYVSGTGSPSGLYGRVPESWWDGFGGAAVELLQYSSSATVPGVSGRCDVSAYRGSLDQLRALALGEDDMKPSDSVPVGVTYGPQLAHDHYQAQYLWVGAFAESRAARVAAEAGNAAIAEMAKTLAALAADRGQDIDVDALVQRIEAAIENVTVHLDVQDGGQ